MVRRWRQLRTSQALRLVPAPHERCGGGLVANIVAPDIPAGVIVPDVTRYGDDVLEVVAPVHLRSRLGLQDHDLLTLSCVDAGHV